MNLLFVLSLSVTKGCKYLCLYFESSLSGLMGLVGLEWFYL